MHSFSLNSLGGNVWGQGGHWAANAPAPASSRGTLPSSFRKAVQKLSQESDPKIFFEDLMTLAQEYSSAGHYDLSLRLLNTGATLLHQDPDLRKQIPRSMALSLQKERDALRGEGALVRRAELFSQRLFHEAVDPIQIAGFGAALSTFNLTRFKLLSCLLPKANQATVFGVLEAQALASVSGVLAESAAFTLATRSLEHFFVHKQDWSASALGESYLSALISLGLLRSGGTLARKALGGIHGTYPWETLAQTRRFASLRPFTESLLPQMAMFGSLYLSGKSQVWRGHRTGVGELALMEEALFSLVHLNVAGHLFNRLQPQAYRNWTQSLELRSQRLLAEAQRSHRYFNFFGAEDSPVVWGALAAAGIPLQVRGQNRLRPPWNGILQMSENSGDGNSSKGEPPLEIKESPPGSISELVKKGEGTSYSPSEKDLSGRSMVVPRFPPPASVPRVEVGKEEVPDPVRLAEEVARIERDLGRLGPLAELGLLVSGYLHNMNNRILPAQIFVDEILPKLLEGYRRTAKPEDFELATQESQKLNAFLSHTTQELQAIRGMVRGVSQPQGFKYGVSIKGVIRDAYGVTIYRLRKGNIKVNFKLPEEDIDIFGNHGTLSNALVNLFDNAEHAMPNGGELTVKAFSEQERAIIEVTDTGIGIPPPILERIFEPLFTTKEPGEGTGLGMYMVKNTVESLHGGKVRVRSEVGRGTTVRLEIPIAKTD